MKSANTERKRLDKRDYKMVGGVKQKLLVPADVVPRANLGAHEGAKRLHMMHKWIKAGKMSILDVSPKDRELLEKYFGHGDN